MSDHVPLDLDALIYEPILQTQDFCSNILNEEPRVGIDDLPEPHIIFDEWAEDTTMHHLYDIVFEADRNDMTREGLNEDSIFLLSSPQNKASKKNMKGISVIFWSTVKREKRGVLMRKPW